MHILAQLSGHIASSANPGTCNTLNSQMFVATEKMYIHPILTMSKIAIFLDFQ